MPARRHLRSDSTPRGAPGSRSVSPSPGGRCRHIERLLALTQVEAVGEQERFWAAYRRVAGEADAHGNLVPDAHVVALMVENGVRTIWTHDRDYRRFSGIEVRDPFA